MDVQLKKCDRRGCKQNYEAHENWRTFDMKDVNGHKYDLCPECSRLLSNWLDNAVHAGQPVLVAEPIEVIKDIK